MAVVNEIMKEGEVKGEGGGCGLRNLVLAVGDGGMVWLAGE